MGRIIGTVSRGLRAPMIREGDDIASIVVETVSAAVKEEGITLHDKDVVAITESIVARAQGNYATIEDIAKDVKQKFPGDTLGVIFPILSRNRFAVCLKGIAKAAKKIILQFSYPSDEVGNHFVYQEEIDAKGINPWSDSLTESEFRTLFPNTKHTFTGMDYIKYYSDIIKSQGAEVEIIFSNQAKAILSYTPYVITCDVHTRERSKRLLREAGAKTVYGLDDILTNPAAGCGYNENYGLLGSNKATEEKVKLFPRDCKPLVEKIQQLLLSQTGKKVEVMVYGDGAFKDPVGKIWELADPVVSPGYTDGLEGTPNEVKLKYLADNEFASLQGEELKAAVTEYIANKSSQLQGEMAAQGTTPRRLTDLLGSLCDLTSGSGDKGTPIILVQGYFDTYGQA